MKLSKLVLLFLFMACLNTGLQAENHIIDSLRNALKTEKDDTNKVITLIRLCRKFEKLGNHDSSLIYCNITKTLSEKLNFKKGIAMAYRNIGVINLNKGDYAQAIECENKSMALNKEIGNKAELATNLSDMGNVYMNQSNYPKALEYFNKAEALDREAGFKQDQAALLCNIGAAYWHQGNIPKFVEYNTKALDIMQEIGNKEGIEATLGNIGIAYYSQNNYPKALEFFFKGLAKGKEIGNKMGMAQALGNIGATYNDQGDLQKALEYELKGLEISKELGNKSIVAVQLHAVGAIYRDLGSRPKAMEYFNNAITIAQEIGDKKGIADAYGDIGLVYGENGDYATALDYDFKALKGEREIGNHNAINSILCNIGNVYTKQKKYTLAKQYLDTTLNTAEEANNFTDKKYAYSGLTELDSAQGDYKEAFKNYKKYIIMRDTLVNQANTKKTVQIEMNYEFDQKQATEKAEQDKKDALANVDKNRQKIIRDSFIAGFVLMLALAFFIFRGYRQKQKDNIIITQQKGEVEKQKALVEEKNKDILDSITYAKRLQDAILPPLSLVKQYLPESFLLYKPKDIVAGDFYWMERAGDSILIAAADCTGHGVPGALVSVVCSNALNRTVKEFKITEPGKILDKVRELVLETFEKSEGKIQDGMDISLCCINIKTNEVQWSGAYNSLWYIQNGEMKELPADKQPIGKTDQPLPFNTRTLNLQKGDSFYLFTDGYADQFGGPKGKKFMYRQLQEKLLSVTSLTMERQKNTLVETLETWKGNLEQVDDILMIGIRI
jgi:tetratricopeptide (TPR) repeat protein